MSRARQNLEAKRQRYSILDVCVLSVLDQESEPNCSYQKGAGGQGEYAYHQEIEDYDVYTDTYKIKLS